MVNDNMSIIDIKLKIMFIMCEFRSVYLDDECVIGYFDFVEEFGKIMGFFVIFIFVGYFVGVLVLFFGVIGISNIMFIVVKECIKEIGVR